MQEGTGTIDRISVPSLIRTVSCVYAVMGEDRESTVIKVSDSSGHHDVYLLLSLGPVGC
jgi:hypothetical protein